MPISALFMPKEARRTTLRLTISSLENLDGAFTNPSLIVSLKYFTLPGLNLIIFLLLIMMVKAEIVRNRYCTKNENSIPNAPYPIDTNEYPIINFIAIPRISIINTLLASEYPSNENRETKFKDIPIIITAAIQINSCNDSWKILSMRKITIGIDNRLNDTSVRRAVPRIWDP